MFKSAQLLFSRIDNIEEKERNLPAVAGESQEKHLRNKKSRYTAVPAIHDNFITQVSEEIQGRVTKEFSQDFSRT